MPDLSTFDSDTPVKALIIGDSGAGKTGSLASLALAGYELFIIDFDRGLDILRSLLRPQPSDGPAKREEKLAALGRIHYRSFTDKLKSVGGRIIPDGMPSAFSQATAFATHWKEDGKDFGPLSTWDQSRVLVWDSLTFSGHAALRYILALNGRMGQHPQIQDWGQAMGMLEDLMALLYSAQVGCHVVMTSHVTYVETEGGGVNKGYPTALGTKLPPKVGRYFNTMVLAETIGSGPGTRRVLRTYSKALIELKTPVVGIEPELPLDTGLATLFEKIRGGPPKPKLAVA